MLKPEQCYCLLSTLCPTLVSTGSVLPLVLMAEVENLRGYLDKQEVIPAGAQDLLSIAQQQTGNLALLYHFIDMKKEPADCYLFLVELYLSHLQRIDHTNHHLLGMLSQAMGLYSQVVKRYQQLSKEVECDYYIGIVYNLLLFLNQCKQSIQGLATNPLAYRYSAVSMSSVGSGYGKLVTLIDEFIKKIKTNFPVKSKPYFQFSLVNQTALIVAFFRISQLKHQERWAFTLREFQGYLDNSTDLLFNGKTIEPNLAAFVARNDNRSASYGINLFKTWLRGSIGISDPVLIDFLCLQLNQNGLSGFSQGFKDYLVKKVPVKNNEIPYCEADKIIRVDSTARPNRIKVTFHSFLYTGKSVNITLKNRNKFCTQFVITYCLVAVKKSVKCENFSYNFDGDQTDLLQKHLEAFIIQRASVSRKPDILSFLQQTLTSSRSTAASLPR